MFEIKQGGTTIKATTHWTPYAKRLAARSMYEKGKNFVVAAVLLQQKRGYNFVVQHLLCQGIEITLKAALLLKDFDRYAPRLLRFGHNLLKLIEAALLEFGLAPLREPLRTDIAQLSSLYSKHALRYGSFLDIFLDPETINSDRPGRRLLAAMRLIDRELRRLLAV
jgi:hypothetical protein